MSIARSIARVVPCLLLMAAAAPLAAANRLYVLDQTVKVGDTGIAVPVRLDNDEVRHGYSLSIRYDETKLKVTGVEVAGTASDGAEWTNGRILTTSPGAISWAVVLDISDPIDINKVIPVGTNLILVNLRADVIATAAGTGIVGPQDNLRSPPEPAGTWTNTLSFRGASTRPTLATGTITIEAGVQDNQFLLGDCNADKKDVPDLSDAVFLLSFLFLGGDKPACAAACEANSDGGVDVSDAVFLLTYLFLGGEKPREPFPACDHAPAAACGATLCGAGA